MAGIPTAADRERHALERIAAIRLLVQGAGQTTLIGWRRIGDPPGVRRFIDLGTARLVAGEIVVRVRGYRGPGRNGRRDSGYDCNTCPIAELEPVIIPTCPKTETACGRGCSLGGSCPALEDA